MKNKEIRELQADELKKKVGELEREMNVELGGKSTSGGRVQNPGKIRTLKRLVARVKTIMREKERGVLK
jgi:large subunit ribosomal protein L29